MTLSFAVPTSVGTPMWVRMLPGCGCMKSTKQATRIVVEAEKIYQTMIDRRSLLPVFFGANSIR
ncbi:hypothetical protein [Burkholderia pseudomallei]|uniref:hypothetical protein n=1 Tax=Burkholderia pseudomallei TaxID=28450 RepID=UPI002933D6B5|nr:hypothetical protein [Burkholderia pseudomallei]MDV2162049.1 hypothetical protein [Burkholderia pseudomallei]MDV2239095.1 hypothetical protein [Burkholderia pseudomallei]